MARSNVLWLTFFVFYSIAEVHFSSMKGIALIILNKLWY